MHRNVMKGRRRWKQLWMLLLGLWLIGVIVGGLAPLALSFHERDMIRDRTKTTIEQSVQAIYASSGDQSVDAVLPWPLWNPEQIGMIFFETATLFLLSISFIGWPLTWLYFMYIGLRFGWTTFFVVDALGITGLLIDLLIFLPLELFLVMGYALLILGARPYVQAYWPFFRHGSRGLPRQSSHLLLTYIIISVMALTIFIVHAWVLGTYAYRLVAEIWLLFPPTEHD
ncbi:MAG: hypothetical protein RBR24_01495 [Candidatus Carbobacillus sp.]|nr:hypothetical protein [Candidatus Carbobacillus sp.]